MKADSKQVILGRLLGGPSPAEDRYIMNIVEHDTGKDVGTQTDKVTIQRNILLKGFVFQTFNLLATMSAFEVLAPTISECSHPLVLISHLSLASL